MSTNWKVPSGVVKTSAPKSRIQMPLRGVVNQLIREIMSSSKPRSRRVASAGPLVAAVTMTVVSYPSC